MDQHMSFPAPIFIGTESLCRAAMAYTMEVYGVEGMSVVDPASRLLHVYLLDECITVRDELGAGLDSVFLGRGE